MEKITIDYLYHLRDAYMRGEQAKPRFVIMHYKTYYNMVGGIPSYDLYCVMDPCKKKLLECNIIRSDDVEEGEIIFSR